MEGDTSNNYGGLVKVEGFSDDHYVVQADVYPGSGRSPEILVCYVDGNNYYRVSIKGPVSRSIDRALRPRGRKATGKWITRSR